MLVAPAATAVTSATEFTFATAGWVLDQFSGALTDTPWLSTTSAARLTVLPAAPRENVVSGPLAR